ncbi:hypothetical protein V2J09_009416 [Rumex salicifolius]
MAFYNKSCFLLLLLLLWASTFLSNGSVALARPINPSSSPSHFGRYSKVFGTLGVECKCCDGECTSSWEGSCSKLHCLPWKFQ